MEQRPTYVSGGGFIMNFAAAMAIHAQIPTTPLIAIDDAYIGIRSIVAIIYSENP